MSQQYDNTNRGSLGRNKRRETDKHPEFSGKINVEGVDYWLSGWVREGNGEKFFSLAVKRKDAPQQDNRAENFTKEVEKTFGKADPIDDAIPF